MSIVIPPGFAEVIVKTNSIAHAFPHTNEVGVDLTDVPVQADLDALSAGLATVYKAYLNSGSAFLGCKLIIGQDGPPTFLESVSGAGNGSRSAALCPPQVQIVCAKKTALASRKGRGRIFLQDVGETDVDDSGVVSGTSLTKAQLVCDALMALGTTSGRAVFGNTVILHASDLEPTALTSFTAESKVGTLRRRFPRA